MSKLLILILIGLFAYFLFSRTPETPKTHERGGTVGPASSLASIEDNSSTCNYLKGLGYFNPPFQATEAMCLKYTQMCGEASNAAVVVYLSKRRGVDGQVVQDTYFGSDPSTPGNYCTEPVACGSSCAGNYPPDPSCGPCPAGLPFTCKSFDTKAGQVSPACY